MLIWSAAADIRNPELSWSWQRVGVLDYEPKSKQWLVQKSDGCNRVLDEQKNPVVNGGLQPTGHFTKLPSQYWIPRIQIRFIAEDPVIFAKRIATAFRAREDTEAGIRYNLYLDCMPTEGLVEMDQAALKRIKYLAKDSTPVLKTKPGCFCPVSSFFRQVSERAYCMLFSTGTVEIPRYDFVIKFDEFAFHTLFGKTEAIVANCTAQFECLEARSRLLLHMPVVKAVRLEEFEQTQAQTTQQSSTFLKEAWIENMRRHIRIALRDSGKGWFNIYETDYYVYTNSKLKRFLNMIKYCMQDALRYLVMDSIGGFVKMVEDACFTCIKLTNGYEWTNDLRTSSVLPKKNALFLVDLVIDKDGVHYSTLLGQFEKVLWGLFDKAIKSIQNISQVERFVVEGISWSDNPLLEAVGAHEPDVEKLRAKLRSCLQAANIPMIAYAEKYKEYIELSELDITHYIKVYETQNQGALEVKQEVERQLEEQQKIEDRMPCTIVIGPFLVNVEPLRARLMKKRNDMAKAMLDLLARQLRKEADKTCEIFQGIAARLFERPNTIEELTELREYIDNIPETMEEQQENIDKCLADYDLIDDFYYNISNDDFTAKWTTIGWPNKVRNIVAQVEMQLEEDEERFRKLQISDLATFADKLDSLTVMVSSMASFTDVSKAHEVANEVRRIHRQLLEAQNLAAVYNSRERLFEMPVTNFEKIGTLLKDFEPFRQLWIAVSDWLKTQDAVMTDPLNSVDASAVEKQVTECYKIMHKSMRTFAELAGVQEVASQIKMAVEEFKPFIPLVQALRNPGMRSRHWELMSETIGIQVVPKASLTFAKCLEMRLQDHIEDIAKIADAAGKEYAIEFSLNKMMSEWEPVNFEVVPYKNTGTYIIKVADEINQQLDDHIVLTQAMSFSPYKKPFEDRIASWENKLHITQDVIDEWMTCQRQWLYLEPIFSSDDINRQLPVEGKRYSTMEKIWRKLMKIAHDSPNVITLCPDSRILANLRECNTLLEQVQKGLSEYLETKRQAFPRFFFLSDDELLEILSQARDPTAVQPHLKKCFENIAKLRFEDDLEITAMFSGEGEKIKFEKTTHPTGNVEEWMSEIENLMRLSVRTVIGKALKAYPQTPRTEWVLQWPGQVVIAGCQTYWTSEVSDSLSRPDSGGLKALFPFLLNQLDGLRTTVRGDLTKIGRMTLSALIVIEVHARDVVDNMIQQGVSMVTDFEWISQLRYYWMEKEEELKLRAVNAEFPYGYEYLGNTTRLVITPLTDRCYLTLTGALHLKFGGAPSGPAGTGKTETTKDLGKAFAVQCVVFNCSDQLDFMAMGKFFKGLASAGAWACFDEFNRIDIEVLSVVAQQITTIQKAQIQRAQRFLFEGVELSLKASCAIFITMNPGYAGRTELPDNLKALFRPVAMMVPDYALIAEISLFSFGFADARILAKKIVTTFKLSSEQLSSQDHYDFGMRAVKSVISAAGNLKRNNPDMDECYEVLRDALTALRNQTSPDGSPFTTVHTYVLNPKSITMGQLYGEFDLLTHEWTDGILSVLIREGVVADDIDKRWYVFDGPVDAVWIENMNTVLDDNKKLCLSSGEIIKLTETMTMMFEVADLAVASPATVSRCGMVYLEPSILGLKPFVECWLAKLPPPVYPHREKLGRLFDFYLEDCISFIRDHTKELIPTTDGQLTFSFLKLFACFFQRFLPKEDIKKGVPRKKDKEKAKKEQNMKLPLRPMGADPNDSGVSEELISRVGDVIESWFFFSLVWSIGASCTNDGRKAFDAFLRQKMKDLKCFRPFPAEGLVYDYFLNEAGTLDLDAKDEEDDDGKPKKVQWENWMQNLKPYTITPTMKYSEILVPTMDNVRLIRLMEMLLLNKRPVICVGPTGTGKTVCIADKLTSGMPKEYIPEFMVFSAKTSANQTQDLIDGKLDKRRKGIFGPPAGKYIIFFIDDLNMPAPEVYGAQPPIELLRQWMDFNGWYDRKTIGAFRTIVDVNFLGALCPPGGGRNPITQRLMRHFNFLSFNELDESSLMTIFPTIVRSWLGQAAEDSPVHALLEYVDRLVKASVDVYTTVQSQLLPTPAKSHYTFNLRDLAHVFQGMLMMDISSLTGELTQILRLWYHESCRVYQDRLINDTDRNWFKDLIKKSMNDVFATPFETAVPSEPLLYGDFLTGAAVEMRKYVEMEDHAVVQRVIEENLEDYNQVSTTQMNLVLFMDAIIHICRIARIIRQPQSNALLLGLGGSGRQSAAKLAAHISEFDCFRIELTKTYSNNDWLEDLRKVMMAAGIENKETMFLFSDTQIKSESFLEDLNNILNAGDVPNIYGFEDLEGIYNAMKVVVAEHGLPATKTNLFSAYVKRVRSNLHTVITMSPLGEIFRARLRQFPALVSCCTIDWYSEWPDEALESVGMRALRDVTELNVPDEILTGIVKMCQEIHQSAVRNTARCLSELGRHNYVTPTSFLELLGAFTKMYSLKLNEIVTARDRTKIGLDKLLYTETFVAKLQEELEVMKPALEQAVEESKVTMEEIARDSAVAAETTAVVSKQEESASKKAEECTAIKDDAQRDLDEAMPALYASLEAVKSLNKNDITEVRAMMRPPEGVRLVMEAVCIMKDVKPKKVAGDKPGVKVDDYWEPGKALLQDPGKFLDSLLTYDRDNIPDSIIARIQPYIDSDAFTPAAIQKVSKACTSICLWVRAMHKYHNVAKSVAPKRAALQAAEIELKATEAILAEARERLKACQDRIASLQTKYDECIRKQKELEDKSALCEARLIRADKLIGGLASEKSRWIVSVDTLDELANNLVGNVLVSSGAVAYLGPFNGEYRAEMCADWIGKLKTLGVPHTTSPAPNLIDTFGDPVKIRNWHIFGLPKDGLSVENAVIVQFSRRWPLFVDPQGQANRWIKALEYDDGVEVLKFSDKEFLRTLENAIRFGKPCLFENIGEELDPVLDPIIMKQTFKQQGTLVIKLGDSIIPYHDDFRLYLTTKLPNPHYKPEITARLTIVNFTLSPSGLEDQLLGIVVAEERPDLEEAKGQLIVSNAQMKQELKEIEDRILERLSATEGSPIDDLDLIATLEASKMKSTEIQSKVVVAEQTEKDIDETRSMYIPVSVRARILFFCVSALANIDPMYQYSLEWFINGFLHGIANAEKAPTVTERIENINNYFTFSLYTNVCRSLFERHKLLFAFLLAIKILENEGLIDATEWRYLLAGGTTRKKELPNPAPEWISDRIWSELLTLDALPRFDGIPEFIASNLDDFKAIFDSNEPHRIPLKEPWGEKLDSFQRLLLLRCLRSDKVTNAMQDFVAHHLGQRFIEPQTTNLADVFKDSSPTTPLIFVLSQGTDPASDLYKFADVMKFGGKKLSAISLGQGQGPRAEELMRSAMERGIWVFFQNCHLAPSWMPALEHLVEQIDPDRVHKDFRLWLTSMPSPQFPVFILQNGSKMTMEPPKGVKANLLRTYLSYDDNFLGSVPSKPADFKHLLLSLSFFHAVCVERKKFGPLGFNIPYEFTTGDLRICVDQLIMFLTEYVEIPFKVLRYTGGQINYGGRVTDDWDRRCLMNMLTDFYHPDVLHEDHVYSPSGIYKQISPESDHAGYLAYIRTLPINDLPEVFGLHDNANITFAQNETFALLGDLLKLQPKTSSSATGSLSREEIIEGVANDLVQKCPAPFNVQEVSKQYPVLYEQSMNTVLIQEVIRFNGLLDVMALTLKDLLKALKGLVVMSAPLEAMATSLFNNQVPALWANKAYPSLKPLASWMEDLQMRINFIQEWIDSGIPVVYWISGFFFPQAFLTGTLQNYARKMKEPVDTITFDFQWHEDSGKLDCP
ncbi:Dynein heavy chain 1, axonemal [Sparganum proliferum]